MSFLLPPLGYASTFYRFKYFFSYLKKRQPQIIADIPHRINKNNPLPILIIIKNADHFPCELLGIEIFIDKQSLKKESVHKKINNNYWNIIYKIDVTDNNYGWQNIDIKISYKLRNKVFTFFNDNYRTTSHAALPCYFSDEDLPALDGYISGDMHTHSNYTDDQIEFGASLSSTAEMSSALGLDFFAATDHSYDLDDYPDNFLKNDPDLKKWHSFLNDVKDMNKAEANNLIIPGEEVSVRNEKNETVHLLVYNDKKYFPGCGDSGEKWFHYMSELSINDVVSSISDKAIAYASHPTDRVPGVHRLLLNRGHWSLKDARHKVLTGVQIFNGHGTDTIEKSITFWKNLLLHGYKSFLLAGNDGHGNFCRNRFISIPFIKISETYTQIFGKWRTDLFLGTEVKSVTNIISVLKKGHYAVSNGPAIDLQLFDENKNQINMGDETDNARNGNIQVKSTAEFGPIRKVIIHQGKIADKQENPYLIKEYVENIFDLSVNFEIQDFIPDSYFRLEVQSEGPKGKHFAFTNPIWVKSNKN